MTSITIVLLILRALDLISIDWWMCFIPTMADIGVGIFSLIAYVTLVWNKPFKL